MFRGSGFKGLGFVRFGDQGCTYQCHPKTGEANGQ